MNRSTLYMKIHTAVWTEKNFEICLKAAADRKALRTGLQLFAAVKYNSDFSKEMTRSVEEYLKQFLRKDCDV